MIYHILKVRPQREFVVRQRLHDMACAAFVPVEFIHRRVRRSQPPQRFRRALMPGYIWAGFAGGVPWHVLRMEPAITGCLSRDGVPVSIPLAEILAVEMMSKPDQQPVRGGSRFRIGDSVSIKTGPWAALPATVQAIASGDVLTITACVQLFGKAHQVVVPETSLEKAA